MATKQDISFGGPAAVIAPDLVVEQQKWQRQQDLIDALKQRALTPIDPGRGSISWTQGLAQLVGALAAKKLQSKNDQRLLGIDQSYSNRMRGQFGMGGAPAAMPAAAPVAAAPQTAPMHAPAPPPAFDQAFGGDTQQALASGAPLPSMPAPTPPVSAPVPPSQDAAPPSQPPQSPVAAGNYPMSLSGNPQQDFNDWAMNPDEYTKAMIANHSPVAMARTVQQARDAMARGDFATAQALLGNVQKENYIAPINGRPGSTIRDPHDPTHILGYDAPSIEGAFPIYGPNGMPAGYQQAPGATQAIAAAAGSKTAGQNANDPITAYDAQGNPVFTNKLAAAQGGNGGNLRPAPPLGAEAAANVTGTNSANAFQAISDAAADVPNRLLALKQMQTLVADPKSVFGKGSEGINKVAGYFGTLTGGERPNVTNANEFNKWAAQYSARSAQELGLNGSDSRVHLAVHATPNGEMTRGALATIIPQFMGLENAKAGMAQAANNWQAQNGPASVQQFRTVWNRNYDPRIYTWMAQGPQAFAQNAKNLTAPERNALRQKYIELKRIGALPQ